MNLKNNLYKIVFLAILTICGALNAQIDSPSKSQRVRTVYASDSGVSLSSTDARATASSEGTYLGITQHAHYAIDGLLRHDGGETWSANVVPAWLKIELPKVNFIYAVELFVEQHSLTINIEASVDGVNWTTVLEDTDVNPHGWRKLYNEPFSYSRHKFDFLPSFPARYVRVNVTDTDAPASHIYQARFTEVRLYAQ